MSIYDPRPAGPSAEVIAEDLSLSNEEATSWFTYRLGEEPGTLEADLLTETGEVEKTFKVRLAFEEVPASR